MKKQSLLILIGVLICSISCTEKKRVAKEIENVASKEKVSLRPEVKKGNELLNKCINAHGGMAKWNSFKALEYNLDDKGKMVYQITHLKDRRAYLKSKEYEVGFDGKVAWALPDASQVSGQSAAFYYNLDFYFMGVPFLLKDPGVIANYEDPVQIDGKSYETLKITFDSGVGLTPEDVYYLYIDPENYLLHILTYSVSYFDKEKAKINSAKVYSGYQEVQGIMMPTKMANFEWNQSKGAEKKMGKSKNHTRLFSDITFLKEVPDETIFEVPKGAVVEKID